MPNAEPTLEELEALMIAAELEGRRTVADALARKIDMRKAAPGLRLVK